MGDAKRRGSRDIRVAEGIAKREAEELERQRHLAELEAAMTPEQKAARKRARHTLAVMSGLVAGMGVR